MMSSFTKQISRRIIMQIMMTTLVAVCACAVRADENQKVIVVVGAAGTDEFGAMFSEWADRWEAAAVAGNADCTTVGRDDNRDDLQKLQQAVSESAMVQTTEPLWVVLIGHGTFDGRVARFNLRGKDVAASDLSEMLNASQRPIAIINSSSCSAPFVNALSGPNRVIVAGTKDGGEIQFARFGGFIADAVGTLDADIDRDGQTSLLEAWLFAAARTEQYYKSDGRLATEHSLLDDSGDGKGIRAEVFEGVRVKDTVGNKDELDGNLARHWHLVRSMAERSLMPEQRLQRNELEEKLEDLRQRKLTFAEDEYLLQLESILIPLAKLYESAELTSPKPKL
jgi:hypothetical protein